MPVKNALVGPYKLLTYLGQGGFGEVWQALEDTGVSQMVFALKFMGANVNLDEVRREVSLWQKAGNHPNVISVIRAAIYSGEVIIVSEYADGGTLQKWLDDNGGKAPSLAWAVYMARGVLAGLGHIQRLATPILHRDLKPDNILLTGPDKRPCLGDFGAATGLTTNHTGTVIGTFGYIPPEAFDGEKYPQSDVWATGAIIYKMLSGRLPFPPPHIGSFTQKALAMQRVFQTPPQALPSDVPGPVQAVVMKALNLDWQQRYQTAAAMLQDLEKALNPVAPVTSSQPQPTVVMPPAPRPLPVTPASMRRPAPTHLQPRGKPLPANAYREFAFTTPTLDATGKVIQTQSFTARSYVEKISGVELEMVEIPGGSFDMGSPKGEGRDTERPQRRVTVPAFFFGKGAVTQGQWRAVATKLPKVQTDLKPEPSRFGGDDMLPVERVSWPDAQEFCARLTNHTGRVYRLPSEAEWEYACRAGTTTPFPFGETITPDLVNYDGNYPYAQAGKGEYRGKTISVFSGKANPFGLYNICGNVWEWCEDIWKDNYGGLAVDGSANVSARDSSFRVLRGGSWFNDAANCRSAYRFRFDFAWRLHGLGFRVASSAAR